MRLFPVRKCPLPGQLQTGIACLSIVGLHQAVQPASIVTLLTFTFFPQKSQAFPPRKPIKHCLSSISFMLLPADVDVSNIASSKVWSTVKYNSDCDLGRWKNKWPSHRPVTWPFFSFQFAKTNNLKAWIRTTCPPATAKDSTGYNSPRRI